MLLVCMGFDLLFQQIDELVANGGAGVAGGHGHNFLHRGEADMGHCSFLVDD